MKFTFLNIITFSIICCTCISWYILPVRKTSSSLFQLFDVSLGHEPDKNVAETLHIPSSPSPSVFSSNKIIEQYMDELISLRGTPELVDRLENLAQKYPGIELNIDLYRAIYPFKLDDFQEKGLISLMSGNNVLVTTPTGSGKTVVGELAIYFALMMGLRVAYTTPLKALSNQKFQDFVLKYGGDRVGLLTGMT